MSRPAAGVGITGAAAQTRGLELALLQDFPELRALQVLGFRAINQVVQPVAYLNQALDMAIQLIRPRRQQPAIERYLARSSNKALISSSVKPARRASAISRSWSSTPAAYWRRKPWRPVDAISPFFS